MTDDLAVLHMSHSPATLPSHVLGQLQRSKRRSRNINSEPLLTAHWPKQGRGRTQIQEVLCVHPLHLAIEEEEHRHMAQGDRE